jgi:hypothetical protein
VVRIGRRSEAIKSKPLYQVEPHLHDDAAIFKGVRGLGRPGNDLEHAELGKLVRELEDHEEIGFLAPQAGLHVDVDGSVFREAQRDFQLALGLGRMDHQALALEDALGEDHRVVDLG